MNLGIALLCLSTVWAHDTGPARVEVQLDQGRYRIDVELHVPEWGARDRRVWEQELARLPEQLEVAIDGRALGDPALEVVKSANGWASWTVGRYQGELPTGAEALQFRAAHATGPWLLVVSGDDPAARLFGGGEVVDVPLEGLAPERLPTTLRRYGWHGFVHIVPYGLDHVLFVLGLFLLADRVRPLLLQVSAFTVAHTLTLGAALLGWVAVPASVVEPLIALSIAAIGVENVWVGRMTTWRPAVVFGFGLLHGLGFAGLLADRGLPPGQELAALFAFDLGVELGQIAVLALAYLVLGRWWRAPWYRRRVVVPGSVLIALVGLYWTAERLLTAWG